MKRGLSFTILSLLGLLTSVAMAMDNNWPAAAFGCVAAGYLFVMAIPHSDLGGGGVHQKSSRAFLALRCCINQAAHALKRAGREHATGGRACGTPRQPGPSRGGVFIWEVGEA
jgi:hypothetical protein